MYSTHPVVGILVDYCAVASLANIKQLAKLIGEGILPLLIDQLSLDGSTYDDQNSANVEETLSRISVIVNCGLGSFARQTGALQAVLPHCQTETPPVVQAAATTAVQNHSFMDIQARPSMKSK